MKKILIILTVLIGSCFNMYPQWKGEYSVDSYSEEKTPMIRYTQDKDFPNVNIVGYQNNRLSILFTHHSTANFDLWWNSHMNDNGWIRYRSDVDLNFIGPDGEEYTVEDLLIKNINNETNDFRFFMYIDDPDGELLSKMKANNKLNIRFYDIVKEKTVVISIPLTGVTAQCKKVGL